MKLIPEAIDDILNLRAIGNRLYWSITLSKKNKVLIKKIIKVLGGKWSYLGRCYLMPDSVVNLFRKVLETGEFPDLYPNPIFYECPDDVLSRILTLANLQPNDVVLEPTAGNGKIVFAVRDAGIAGVECTAVELDWYGWREIERSNENKKHRVKIHAIWGDFQNPRRLRLPAGKKYNVVLCVPPIWNETEIRILNRAYDELEPDGRFIGVVSPFLENTSHPSARRFKKILDDHLAYFEELPKIDEIPDVKMRIVSFVKI